jgi:hypothetical protein
VKHTTKKNEMIIFARTKPIGMVYNGNDLTQETDTCCSLDWNGQSSHYLKKESMSEL